MGSQPSHITSDLQFVLLPALLNLRWSWNHRSGQPMASLSWDIYYDREPIADNAWRVRTQSLDNPETHDRSNMNGYKGKKKSMKWFLMILHYTHKLLPSLIVIRDASSCNWWKQIQRFAAKHLEDIEKFCGRGGERIMGARGAKNTKGMGICTESGDLGSWGLMETEPPARERSVDCPGPFIQVFQLCDLVLFWDFWQRDSVVCSWNPFFSWGWLLKPQ